MLRLGGLQVAVYYTIQREITAGFPFDLENLENDSTPETTLKFCDF